MVQSHETGSHAASVGGQGHAPKSGDPLESAFLLVQWVRELPPCVTQTRVR